MSDSDGPPPRKKQYTFKSYQESLKSVHLPAASSSTAFDEEIGDTESHFHNAIEHWQQLNLAPSFLNYAKRIQRISESMALLLLNWQQIVEMWVETISACEEDALRPLLGLMQNLAHDLRTTILPQYPTILTAILDLLKRPLTSETLTALLSALSTLFRYVVMPSPHLLRPSWLALRKHIIEASAKAGGVAAVELQRMLAEVWGAVLRRLKSASRNEVVDMMVDGLENCEESIAWAFISAMKAPSGSLHPCVPLLLQPLLESHFASSDTGTTFVLLRRILTALMHHVSNAQNFTVVSDLLVQQYKTEVEDQKFDRQQRLCRLWRLLSIISGVRKGKRLTQKNVASVLSLSALSTVELTREAEAPYLEMAVSVLGAGEMSAWMGPGRKVVERVWQHDKFLGLQLSGCLAEINWGGWRLIVLPYVLRNILSLLEDPNAPHSKALALFARFHSQGRLDDADETLRLKLGEWITQRLDGVEWTQRADHQVMELGDISTLASLVPSSALVPSMVKIAASIVKNTPDQESAKGEYSRTAANGAWVLGTALQALVVSSEGELAENHLLGIEVPAFVEKVIKVWGWNSFVLEQLVAFVGICPKPLRDLVSLTFSDVFATIEATLLSNEQPSRLSSLRLLLAPFVDRSQTQEEACKKCLAAEELALDVLGYRERIIRIGRIPDSIGSNNEPPVVVIWLIAQLKVNIRPLWAAAAQALATLLQRRPEEGWNLLFRELQAAAKGETGGLGVSNPEWSLPPEDTNQVVEEEKTWRCPSYTALQTAVARWTSAQERIKERELIKAQLPTSRLDVLNYEAQLLHTLTECPRLAEKNNRDLIPFFLAQNSNQSMPRPRLSNYLTLFSKFSNPKSLYQAETLRSLYLDLIAIPDRTLQKLALDCLLTFKSPNLLPHEPTLRLFLDDVRWRDELSKFDFNGEVVEEEHRAELSTVVTRLMYGIIGERRKGQGSGGKVAALGLLSSLRDHELKILVHLMLKPLGGMDRFSGLTDGENGLYTLRGLQDGYSNKQGVGFLVLLGDVLRMLGPKLVEFWPSLLGATIEVLANAQDVDGAMSADIVMADGEVSDAEADDEAEEELFVDSSTHLLRPKKINRNIRQLGLKRFSDFFRVPMFFDYKPYMATSFKAFLSPRLSSLDKENSQNPTATLELFLTWSKDSNYVPLLQEYDARVLPKVFDCLRNPAVQAPVILKIFEIVETLREFSTNEDVNAKEILDHHINHLLECLTTLVERTTGGSTQPGDMVPRFTKLLASLSPLISDGVQASQLLRLTSPLLKKPFRIIPDRTKSDILLTVQRLVPLVSELQNPDSESFSSLYELLALLFQNLRNIQARSNLVNAFKQLTQLHPSIPQFQQVHQLLAGLNAMSIARPEEPDFEARLKAFNDLNESLYSTLTAKQWLPLLYNMLFCIQGTEELVLRNTALFSLRRLVDVLTTSTDPAYDRLFKRILYPALRNGMRNRTEAVRSDCLSILGYAVKKCDNVASLQEMKPLLIGGDEEANFFNNILHIQVHRRVRALHRLREICGERKIRSSTLAEIFVPLLGHFIVQGNAVDHSLINETIATIGFLSEQLPWSPYNLLMGQYLKLAKEKTPSEKIFIRTLIAILDHFHFSMEEVVPDVQEQDVTVEEDEPPVQVVSQTTKIVDAVNTRILPNLIQYVEKRGDTDDSIRIPVAIGVVKVALHLPQEQRDMQISRIITVLSQILRSKTQDTRDLTKETLCKIVLLLGPQYLHQITKELRHALTRGPQLHVLASVVHYILSQITSPDHASRFQKLDDAAADIAHVSAEVIFGQSGKDVMNEDFKTKMREVKGASSRGLESFMLLARHVSPSRVASLLEPCRGVMHETGAMKMMVLVDDVLRRVASGLNNNPLLTPPELLILIHTLVSQNAKFLQESAGVTKRKIKGKVHQDIEVNLKVKRTYESDHYANNSFRFVCFGLDLFITAYKRNRFAFDDSNIISRLQPLVPLVGNTLYSTNAQVLVLALRATAAIVKCPLANIPKSLPVFVKQTLDIVRKSGTTESEVVQTALKTLAILIRDRSDSELKESDLTYLLQVISPDLEEPDRQAAVFTLLRAIVSRKFVVPEIYDLMDRVSETMVTNQSPQVQELCRSVLLQFLLDYPQGKGRLRNQMQFLAKNLSYVFEGGRRSVMELLGAVFAKFDPTLLQQYNDLFFVALVMVLVNDDSAKCREKAAELLKLLLKRLDEDQRKATMGHLHSWASQFTKPQLARVAAQGYGIAIDVFQQDIKPFIPTILADINLQLVQSHTLLLSVEGGESMEDESSMDWQAPYQALTCMTKLLRLVPDLIINTDKVKWEAVLGLMLYPHMWVRLACTRLQGMVFTAIPVTTPNAQLASANPLSPSSLVGSVRKLSLQLKSDNLDSALGLQVVKNLFYIGKCFALAPVSTGSPDIEQPGAGDEDDVSEDEEEEAGGDERLATNEKVLSNPLAWMITKLSHQVRAAHIARRNVPQGTINWAQQPTSILKWLAAMAAHLNEDVLSRYLVHILTPVYRIMDDATIKDPQMDELRSLAAELQDLVQSKVGTTRFAAVYNDIRQAALAVRRERKTARVMKATTDPEAAARRRLQRNVSKKESRKRKNKVFSHSRETKRMKNF